MSKIEDKIQDLIETKDFDELSATEQEMVLAHCTEGDYVARRETLNVYKEKFSMERSYMQPSLASLSVLRDQIDQRNEQKGIGFWAQVSGLLLYKVPTYQVGFVICFVIGGLFLLWGKNAPVIQYVDRDIVVSETKIDTVFVEKIIEVPVVRLVDYSSSENSDVPALMTSYTPGPDPLVEEAFVPEVDDITQSFGNTSLDNFEVDHFRVGM